MARTRDKRSALKNAAILLGRKGGKAGGPARARVLTPQERIDIAAKGGKASAGVQKTGR